MPAFCYCHLPLKVAVRLRSVRACLCQFKSDTISRTTDWLLVKHTESVSEEINECMRERWRNASTSLAW